MSKFPSPGAKLLLVANLAHLQITLFNFRHIKGTQIVCLHDVPVDTFFFSTTNVQQPFKAQCVGSSTTLWPPP